MRVDLNADVGESFGAYSIGHDSGLMTVDHVRQSSPPASTAAIRPSCDTRFGWRRHHGVAIGAHPGFPDLAGFGRRDMQVSAAEAEDLVLYQIAAVAGVASAEGMRLQHVKPHGALYNMAARDERPRVGHRASRGGIRSPADSVWPSRFRPARAGQAAGLRVAAEGFADRAYEPDGSLVSRTKPGAVIDGCSTKSCSEPCASRASTP